MTRSVLPSFLRLRAPSERLRAPQNRAGASLPSTPAIDPWTVCGVSLVELSRMAEDAIR